MTLGTYTWDALSRRAELDYGNTASVKYTYSDAGDLLTLNHDLSGTADDVQYTLGYSNAHQLTSEVSSKSSYNFAPASNGTDSYAVVNSLNQYPAVKAVFYGYDSRGNLTGDGNFTYSYDPENHLILANATGNANTYAYDPLGRRVTKTVNATAVANFLQDGDTEIAEYDASGNVLRRFVPGPAIDDTIAMVPASGTTTFFHSDHHGSVIAMSGASAAKTEGPYVYDTYGAGTALTGVPFRYTGQYLDAETGLYYYRARFYNPAIGGFMQTDPVGYDAGMNLYEYADDDPTDKTDPSGNCPPCAAIAIAACVDGGCEAALGATINLIGAIFLTVAHESTKKDAPNKSESRRHNWLPPRGTPGTTATNKPGTQQRKYGADGHPLQDWNEGHPGAAPPEDDKHVHDYKPNPKNPTGKPTRLPGRKPDQPGDLTGPPPSPPPPKTPTP